MKKQLIELVSKYSPTDKKEVDDKNFVMKFLSEYDDITGKDNPVGHITASAWVISPDGKSTLLTHHKKLNRWLQLGGHVEDDATIQEAALREACEESGIFDLLSLGEDIFDLDVHIIPQKKLDPEHYHLDIRFAFKSKTKDFLVSDESNNLSWVEISAIEGISTDESIIRMAKKTSELLLK